MTAQISKSEQDERGLLPYPVIIAATKGDPEAMNIVVQHYESYIASLSMRKLRDERGNIYWGIDEDLRERLQAKLMRAVLNFQGRLTQNAKRPPFRFARQGQQKNFWPLWRTAGRSMTTCRYRQHLCRLDAAQSV
mgnify:CR=1 FL=1